MPQTEGHFEAKPCKCPGETKLDTVIAKWEHVLHLQQRISQKMLWVSFIPLNGSHQTSLSICPALSFLLPYTCKHWFSYTPYYLMWLLGRAKGKAVKLYFISCVSTGAGQGKGLSKCERFYKTEAALPQFTIAPHPFFKGCFGSEFSPVSSIGITSLAHLIYSARACFINLESWQGSLLLLIY